MNDEELKELFAAFDAVSATDSLKAATLARIASVASEACQDATEELPAPVAETPQETQQMPEVPDEVPEQPESPKVKAIRGGSRRAAKWRTIRVAAVAACLVLALTGGVAYATPMSYVTVTQGNTTIELGVNVFGYAITASASDDAGNKLIEEMDLLNVPFEKSVTRVTDSMKQSNPDSPVEVVMESGGVSQALQENGTAVVEQAAATSVVPTSTESQVARDGAGDGRVARSDANAGGSAQSGGSTAQAAEQGIHFDPVGVVGSDQAAKPSSESASSSGASGFASDGYVGGTDAGGTQYEEPAGAESGSSADGEIGTDDAHHGQSGSGESGTSPQADDEAQDDQPPQRYGQQNSEEDEDRIAEGD